MSACIYTKSTEREASLSQLWTHRVHTVIPFCVVIKDRTQIFVWAHLFTFTVTERCYFCFCCLFCGKFMIGYRIGKNWPWTSAWALLQQPTATNFVCNILSFSKDVTNIKLFTFIINVKWSGRILDKSALQQSASQDQRRSIIKLLNLINY